MISYEGECEIVSNSIWLTIWRSLIGSFIFCRSDLLREVYTRCDNAAFANFVAATDRGDKILPQRQLFS